jgi:hypothetical protein
MSADGEEKLMEQPELRPEPNGPEPVPPPPHIFISPVNSSITLNSGQSITVSFFLAFSGTIIPGITETPVSLSVGSVPPGITAALSSQSLPLPMPATSSAFSLTLTAAENVTPAEATIEVEAVHLAAAAHATVTVNAVASGQVGLPAFTPRESLEFPAATNPAPPSGGDWATEIVKENRSSAAVLASLLSLAVWADRGDDYPVCSREWTQVTAPGEDYDEDSVAFSGWLLQPDISRNDVPFTHPFGFDWECEVALDPEYAGLLAAGNTVPDADGTQALAQATGLDVPVPEGGLMAVETDSRCVPSALHPPNADTVRIGDRIAALGRWIVDAGHSFPVGSGKSYHAEVHPPLLMAIGGTRTELSGVPLDVPVTRILLTSRPYLVKQVYTTDTGTIYNDEAPDDGTLLQHFNNEIDKLVDLIPESWTIEAHPKIASKPFKGVHFANVRVRPPDSAGRVPVLGGPVVSGPIQVSFQFTCRSGVGVEVVAAEDGVDLMVVLNDVGYTAPLLPQRQSVTLMKDQLAQASDLVTFEQIASIFQVDLVAVVNAEQALARGIETDSYEVPDVDVLDQSHMVPFVDIGQIRAGQGIVVDDSQPYPVFGFLEIRRLRLDIAPGGNDSEAGQASPVHQVPPPEAPT